ncbi:PLAC8-domain-containing protein [Pluteus cervinus]|uniref:PLAC8-domain-containing protein n=1 Tax=Pluteus cervinus TaxID=181527 RepID=A0ACD3A1E3_9AGAR|nr:PLAC8-domain-containing protein [Pluteus cervinus]
MTLQGGNRNVKNLPMNNGHREWSHGLCDCCDDAETCIVSWFCPCIVYAQNKRRLEYLERNGVPDPEHGGDACSGDCCLHLTITGCCGLGWLLQIPPRSSVRNRYHIEGSTCGDCCAILLCSPCALTQESREIGLEENSIQVTRV